MNPARLLKAVDLPARLPSSPVSSPSKWIDRRTLIGLGWLIGFVLFFSWFDLPNNRPVTRADVWNALPLQVLDVVWPLPEPNAPPTGLQFLPQRLPAIGIALLMWGAALGLGTLSLKLVRIENGTPAERLFFAGGVGLSLWSLITLGLGLAGGLWWAVFWSLVIAGNAFGIVMWWTPATTSPRVPLTVSSAPWLKTAVLAVCVPWVWAMLLGACTPQTDFDVVEYHLNGPKEWYQQGAVAFLPHNVYTSFPFLTEMLLLCGMVLAGDCYYGALTGQIVLMVFAPLTALGLYCAGRRWFCETAGWLAVLVFLTTPWTYRISIIAYAEGGLSYYILASFLAASWAVSQSTESTNTIPQRTPWVLTGFLAGSAMACKYPGLPSAILPIGLGIAIVLKGRRISLPTIAAALSLYGLGVLLAVGPWLAKNLCETGNPVYPLLYSVFGGFDFDPTTNLRWVKAHAAPQSASWSAFGIDAVRKFTDIIANNDWHSPLLYGLAPLSWFWSNKKPVMAAWAMIGWLFLTWFLLTHHIDRFWVPMIPIVALLAGAGAAKFTTPIGKIVAGLLIIACLGFNVTICALIGGYNAGLTDLRSAETIAERSLTPELQWLNNEYAADRLPANFRLLCVGEAATFHARFPVIYNTVFDQSWLEAWCTGPDHNMRSAADIRSTLQSHGVTHVFINWREILRYREPGSYGYTDFVHPDRIRQLEDIGVLGPALPLPGGLGIAPLNDDRRKLLSEWSPSLIVKSSRDPAYISAQIFPVQ